MRLSTVQMFQQGVDSILRQQAELSKTQQQLASGRRILKPSDDPVGAAQILNLSTNIATNTQYSRNIDFARGELELEESVLSQAGTNMQRVRELVIQANNATQSPESRRVLGVEIKARLDEMLGLANTRNSDGQFIFAGYQTNTQPFVKQTGGVIYQGDQGQRFVRVSDGSQIAVRDNGADVFTRMLNGDGRFQISAAAANTGNAVVHIGSEQGAVEDTYTIAFSRVTFTDPTTYTITGAASGVVATGTYLEGDTLSFNGIDMNFSGTPDNTDSFTIGPSSSQDIFTTLQELVNVLSDGSTNPEDTAARHTILNQSLNNLDQAMDHILEVRTDLGIRLAQLDSQQSQNEDVSLLLKSALADIQDLDFAEAASQLNIQLTALEAAQASFIRVQGLSLFDFLR